MVRGLAGIALLIFILCNSTHAAGPQWGTTVVGIQLDTDAHLSIENFSAQIAQKVGQPLDRSKISESLKNLFATGRFVDLRAESEPKGEGVEVVFVGRAQYFVGMVSVDGAPGVLTPGSLTSTTRLRLGQPLTESDLSKAHEHLAATLAEEGYYQPKIIHAVQSDTDSQEAEVKFTIVPGRPATLAKIEFEGHPVFPNDRLVAISHLRLGHRLTSNRLERALLKIHQFYVNQGHLQAYTRVESRPYDSARHIEKLVLLVEAGPLIRVHVIGARLSTGNMKQLLPMFSDGVTDDFALQQGQRNLEDHFQRQGYFSVKAKGERNVNPNSQEIDITYHVTLGPAGEFDGYAFKGNKAFADYELSPLLSLQVKDFPFTWSGAFSHTLLEHDVTTLKTYYQAQGFAEVKVNPRLENNYANLPNHLFVVFEIVEGPRQYVGHLTLDGVDLAMRKQIESTLPAKTGQPYSPANAEAIRQSILTFLGNTGFNSPTVTWKASPVSPTNDVDLSYDIHPGLQVRVQRIVLMGNQHTRSGIIRRQVLFRPGEPLRQSDVFESQRKLYDLGIFNQVQIGAQNPQTSETHQTMLVKVEEGRRWTVGYGGGIEFQRLGSNQPQGSLQVSPRLSLDVSRLNVGGRGQTFTIRGRLSNLETSAGTSYLIQHLPTRYDLSLRVTGLFDRSRDVETFSAERSEGSISLEKHYGPSTLLVGRYTYRKVLVDSSTLHISPDQIPLLSRPARIGLVGMSFIKDQRDNPADATQGAYTLVDFGISASKLGSQANFLRFSGQYSTYYSLGRHLVFARNTRIGIESPYGALRKVIIPASATAPAQVLFTHDIPLPERFFMGGSESDRGFSINQAGPRDPITGFPVGGNALFLNSFELRIRVEENRLGFALFHDFGNVYSNGRVMRLLKFGQNSPTDLNYTSHAIGVGIRYNTPIGPLRLDVGYNLNPPRFQVQNSGGLGVSQLSHTQFFLGVGQTF